jgi:hypothetical protein
MHTLGAMATTVMNVTAAKRTEFSIKRIRPADGQTLQARLAPPARLFCIGAVAHGAALRLSGARGRLPLPNCNPWPNTLI